MVEFVRDMDTPLLQLNRNDTFSLRDAFNGVHVFGAIGSGKTSGAGRALAGALLRAGAGGLVLCAKPDEVELWKGYAKQHGRESSVILCDETQGINFINAELAKKGAGAISSVTDFLMQIIEASDLAAGQTSRQGETFWVQSSRMMLLYTVALLYGATGNVTIASIIQFINTMPQIRPSSDEQKVATEKTFAVKLFNKCLQQPARQLPADIKNAAITYWGSTFLSIPDKTRGSIIITATASLTRFTSGMLRKCFTEDTTILPEMCFSGAIIICALPVLTYNHEGIIANQLLKLLFQRAVEARNALAERFRERPVFLYADEAQYFVNSYDDTFLSTCRSSRCSVVFLSQSLPTYYGMLGKEKSDKVDGFVGKFATKIFHLNADPRTNKYASDLIGKGLKLRKTTSENTTTGINTNRGGTQNTANQGFSKSESTNTGSSIQEYEAQLVPENYFATQLKTGGAKNGCLVTAVLFKAGGNFCEPIPDTNGNQCLVTFSQN